MLLGLVSGGAHEKTICQIARNLKIRGGYFFSRDLPKRRTASQGGRKLMRCARRRLTLARRNKNRQFKSPPNNGSLPTFRRPSPALPIARFAYSCSTTRWLLDRCLPPRAPPLKRGESPALCRGALHQAHARTVGRAGVNEALQPLPILSQVRPFDLNRAFVLSERLE
jgi:hypothetical protein